MRFPARCATRRVQAEHDYVLALGGRHRPSWTVLRRSSPHQLAHIFGRFLDALTGYPAAFAIGPTWTIAAWNAAAYAALYPNIAATDPPDRNLL